jgi:hypothetical protein
LPVSDLLHKHTVVLFTWTNSVHCTTSWPHVFDAANTHQPQWPTVPILHIFIFCLSSFLLFIFLNLYALPLSPSYYCVHIYNQYTSKFVLITNLMHNPLFCNICITLYTSTCFEQYYAHLQEVKVVFLQHLVSSLSVTGRTVHRSQPVHCTAAHREWRYKML